MATISRNPKTRRRSRRSKRQLGFDFRTWGGARPGAGRKPSGPRPGVPHQPREPFTHRVPLHVTIRSVAVCNLRDHPVFAAVEEALLAGANRFGVRLVEFSVQGEHIHLLVEAPRHDQLPRAIKGLSVRLAHRVNRLLGRRGRFIRDRFHSRRLRRPSEVARVKDYIRENRRRHLLKRGRALPAGWIDPCWSNAPGAIPLPAPLTWLVRESRREAPS